MRLALFLVSILIGSPALAQTGVLSSNLIQNAKAVTVVQPQSNFSTNLHTQSVMKVQTLAPSSAPVVLPNAAPVAVTRSVASVPGAHLTQQVVTPQFVSNQTPVYSTASSATVGQLSVQQQQAMAAQAANYQMWNRGYIQMIKGPEAPPPQPAINPELISSVASAALSAASSAMSQQNQQAKQEKVRKQILDTYYAPSTPTYSTQTYQVPVSAEVTTETPSGTTTQTVDLSQGAANGSTDVSPSNTLVTTPADTSTNTSVAAPAVDKGSSNLFDARMPDPVNKTPADVAVVDAPSDKTAEPDPDLNLTGTTVQTPLSTSVTTPAPATPAIVKQEPPAPPKVPVCDATRSNGTSDINAINDAAHALNIMPESQSILDTRLYAGINFIVKKEGIVNVINDNGNAAFKIVKTESFKADIAPPPTRATFCLLSVKAKSGETVTELFGSIASSASSGAIGSSPLSAEIYKSGTNKIMLTYTDANNPGNNVDHQEMDVQVVK